MTDRIERELDGIVDQVLAYKPPDKQKARRRGPTVKSQKQKLTGKAQRNRRQRKAR
jgi:hypothetical protein